MSEDPRRQATRLGVTIGRTQRAGEFDFDKIIVSLERDLAALENPLDAYRDISALLNKALSEIKPKPPVPAGTSEPPRASGLKQNDTAHSATPLEKAAESLRWGKSTNNPARQWTKIKDIEESPELKQVLIFIRAHAVNGYATIGSHVYRIEGEGQFLGRYPKREGGKA